MKRLIHAIFNCQECEFIVESYLTAQEKARSHANETGHKVSGELGYSVVYSGKAGEGV